MILFFSNLAVSEQSKLNRLVERAKSLYNSDYYDIQNEKWLADKLTVESLFPSWLVKAAEDNPNVLVISIIKNYMRWLLSITNGYGAQLEWENIRSPILANKIFLEAYLDFYFPGANFAQNNLKSAIDNVRQFSVKADENYFNIKGTPAAIKYLICSLFAIPWDSVVVFTGNTNILTVKIGSAYASQFEGYKSFLETHVFPAGVAIVYETL